MATVAGNLAHGDPANDHPATMLALGAEIVATGPKGERVLPIEGFFLSLFTTALQPDEIITEIRVPFPPPRIAVVLISSLSERSATLLLPQSPRKCPSAQPEHAERAGLALTNVGATPIKAAKAEAFLRGKKLDEANITAGGATCCRGSAAQF